MAATQNPRTRRRKKRRTEDFSSDSDSDSDSLQEAPNVREAPPPTETATQSENINIDDIDIASESEEPEKETAALKITFTTTEQLPLQEAKEAVQKDRTQLENEYLAFMAGQFENDLDQLRQKPDFTASSIVILAKTLQSGANMFDSEVLEALLP